MAARIIVVMELFLYRIILFDLAQSKLIHLQRSYFTYMRQYTKKVLARSVILNINNLMLVKSSDAINHCTKW